MQLPIGYEDFSEVIESKLVFVDKSLFIQEILDEIATKVIVITRPRRFGKTLNLSMLRYFLAIEAYGGKAANLFNDLKIAALGEKYLQHQGKYPVIFITFKGVRDHSFQHSLEKLSLLLANVYNEHSYLLHSPHLDTVDKQFITLIRKRTLEQSVLEEALHRLTYYLFKHYNTKVWLLVDEYDTPMQSAFLHDYYEDMANLIRGLFAAALKTNPYLERAVITGILRIAKESLFSGLNNIKVYSLLHSKFGEYFGFTGQEITDLLTKAQLTSQADAIQHWYNGYSIGDRVIYNPWSIANCINENGALQPYWVNTSSNDLIKHLLAQGDKQLKENLALLLEHKPIETTVDENMVFGNLEQDQHALWSLLLFSGYLKVIDLKRDDTYIKARLVPPNYEVYLLYRSVIRDWFTEPLGKGNYESF